MKHPAKNPHLLREFATNVRQRKAVAAVYFVLRFAVIAIAVFSALDHNYENLFLCILVLILFMLPALVQRKLKIELPNTLEIVILFFIFAAEILGELRCYFVQYPNWDTMLHTISGFLWAAIGFSMVDVLNRNKPESFRLSPLYLALVAFCFSMTVGVLWEFFEFAMDRVFLLDMQKDTILQTISSVALDPTGRNIPVVIKHIAGMAVNGQPLPVGGYLDIGLYDTMQDLFVNFLGAVIFSVIGFFYARNHGTGRVVSQFVPRVRSQSPPPKNEAGGDGH